MSVLEPQAAVTHGFNQQQLPLWNLPDTHKKPHASLPTPDESSSGSCSPGEHVETAAVPEPRLGYDAAARWRPSSHIMPTHGWMNDPCAPGYDSSSGLYHVNFQWNPYGHVWGNMSWGSATSPDMVNWTVSKAPSMEPTAQQDKCGVFTGALWSQNKDLSSNSQSADGMLTSFYTSAQSFPISYRLPYTRGSEKLALATSHDSGRTWKRASQNVILDGPPAGYDVTGWRDPFVGNWASIDFLNGSSDTSSRQYGILSGGLRDETPTIFLYRLESGSTPRWTFLSSLVNLGLNFSPSRWTGGDFGKNFEVTNFLTLSDGRGKPRDVLITSVEGRQEDAKGGELSKDHRQMWMSGPLKTGDDGGSHMEFQIGGALDHGCFYAANGFWDPLTSDFVTFGWIFEEDLPAHLVEHQGWSGCLSLPRIASLHSWKGVVGTIKSQLSELTSFHSTQEMDGTYTLETVSLTPDPRLKQRRIADLCPSHMLTDGSCLFPTAQSQIVVDASLLVTSTRQQIGFDIVHSADAREYTRVFFDSSTEMVVIDRSQSTRVPGIKTSPKEAPHTLLEFKDDGMTVLEELRFHAFFDTSVLEVFVNDRVAITTRVYPEEGTCYGVRMYICEENEVEGIAETHDDKQKGREQAALLRNIDIWSLDANVSHVD